MISTPPVRLVKAVQTFHMHATNLPNAFVASPSMSLSQSTEADDMHAGCNVGRSRASLIRVACIAERCSDCFEEHAGHQLCGGICGLSCYVLISEKRSR